MRPEDLKSLADSGHEVGSHGVSHISLRAMPKEMAKRELIESRARIAEWTGKVPVSFAYPYGDTKSSAGEPSNWLQEAGYEFGLTIQRGKVDRSSNSLLLPRDHAEGNWSIRDLKFFLLS
jgi:peptidoglycan/xylan/chitin deacetylase (PgdA/CDA1 family)